MGEPYRDRPQQDGDQEGDDLTTKIATYATIIEAEMSRAYLGAHGIEAFTCEAASFNPMMNVATGGAQLLVWSSDEARARSFLERAARTPTPSREDDEEEGDVRCPRCELTYCYHEKAFSNEVLQEALTSPLSSLFRLPFQTRRERWHCHKCLYVWDDAGEGPKRATPLDAGDPRPVFRWRSHQALAGVVAGVVVMFAVWALAFVVGAEGALLAVFLGLGCLSPIAGYGIGRRAITDVCSAPHCRAVLPQADEECASCHGAIVDVIEFGHEHHARAAEFRRELRALKAAGGETAAPGRTRPKKRRKPRESRKSSDPI